MFKKTFVQVFPTYYNRDDLQLAINQWLYDKRNTYVDLKFSTNEILVEMDGKGKKVIAYHAILIYKI